MPSTSSCQRRLRAVPCSPWWKRRRKGRGRPLTPSPLRSTPSTWYPKQTLILCYNGSLTQTVDLVSHVTPSEAARFCRKLMASLILIFTSIPDPPISLSLPFRHPHVIYLVFMSSRSIQGLQATTLSLPQLCSSQVLFVVLVFRTTIHAPQSPFENQTTQGLSCLIPKCTLSQNNGAVSHLQ